MQPGTGCPLPRGKKKRPHQCHDHSSLLMWLMVSISFLGFCCSDLALDASLEVTADIIPIEISSKPATQFIHKFKYTHYQVRRKNIKTHLLPFPTPFLTIDHSTPRCVAGSHRKLGQEKLSRTAPEKIMDIFSNEKDAERAIPLLLIKRAFDVSFLRVSFQRSQCR